MIWGISNRLFPALFPTDLTLSIFHHQQSLLLSFYATSRLVSLPDHWIPCTLGLHWQCRHSSGGKCSKIHASRHFMDSTTNVEIKKKIITTFLECFMSQLKCQHVFLHPPSVEGETRQSVYSQKDMPCKWRWQREVKTLARSEQGVGALWIEVLPGASSAFQ